VSIDKIKVKNYLLDTSVSEKKTTVWKCLLGNCFSFSFMLLIALGSCYYLMVMAPVVSNVLTRIFFIFMILSVLPLTIINLKEHKKVVVSWESGSKKSALGWWFKICKWYGIPLLTIIVIIFLHMIVFPEAEEMFIHIVRVGMCILFWPVLMTASNILCHSIYKLYLLRKCCPDLQNEQIGGSNNTTKK